MRVGEFYVLCGLADETGLLWYETKFSKQLTGQSQQGGRADCHGRGLAGLAAALTDSPHSQPDLQCFRKPWVSLPNCLFFCMPLNVSGYF